MPFTIHSHCMVQYSDNIVYLIGGWQDGVLSDKTWIIDMTNGFKIEEGPTLPKNNHLYTCSSMVVDGDTILAASGGSTKFYQKSKGVKIVAHDLEYSRSLLFLNPRKENQWIIGALESIFATISNTNFKFMSYFITRARYQDSCQ